jgi:hypothetical protein
MKYPESWNTINAALSHDWLTGMRGGERVLEILCDGFPSARIHTLIHKPGSVSSRIEKHPVSTSWVNGIPGVAGYYRNLLPLFPSAIERMRTEDVDLVISTSHCVAKGLRAPSGGKHIC